MQLNPKPCELEIHSVLTGFCLYVLAIVLLQNMGLISIIYIEMDIFVQSIYTLHTISSI